MASRFRGFSRGFSTKNVFHQERHEQWKKLDVTKLDPDILYRAEKKHEQLMKFDVTAERFTKEYFKEGILCGLRAAVLWVPIVYLLGKFVDYQFDPSNSQACFGADGTKEQEEKA